jgi:hypothetical protein
MTDTPMPKVASLGQIAPNHLDVPKLLEAARGKLAFARSELDRIQREHAMKSVEITENARRKMDEVRNEAREALRVLDIRTRDEAQPARDMIDLVERMLNDSK